MNLEAALGIADAKGITTGKIWYAEGLREGYTAGYRAALEAAATLVEEAAKLTDRDRCEATMNNCADEIRALKVPE